MNDTPETDALREAIDSGGAVEAEMTSLAEKLERERDEARDDCERLNRLLRHETALGQGEIDHWAALERERDEAIRALTNIAALPTMAVDQNVVRARKIAQEALRNLEDTK